VSKILAQAGSSLADVYDVEGSIIGIEQLVTQEVQLVHELGGQIHSERLTSFVSRINANEAQSSSWGATSVITLPDSVARILAVTVLIETTGTVLTAGVSIFGPGVSGEIPIWSWDSAIDAESAVRMSVEGGSFGSHIMLRPAPSQALQQTIVCRMGVNRTMPQIRFGGTTAAFGGGTVDIDAFIYFARPELPNPAPGEPSSHGLPIPSW